MLPSTKKSGANLKKIQGKIKFEDSPRQHLEESRIQKNLDAEAASNVNENIDCNGEQTHQGGSLILMPPEDDTNNKTALECGNIREVTKFRRRLEARTRLLSRYSELQQEGGELLPSTIVEQRLPTTSTNESKHLTGLPNNIPVAYSDEISLRFVSARTKVLKDELQATILECVEKGDKVSALEKQLKVLDQKRNKILRENSSKDVMLKKYQRTCDEQKARADEFESRCGTLKKEVEMLNQGQKQLSASKSSTEVKLNHALQDLEQHKDDLQLLKQTTSDSSVDDKKKIQELSAENKNLEKQKSELITLSKTQLRLIDNLKRQNIHLEATKILQFTEEEFMKSLY